MDLLEIGYWIRRLIKLPLVLIYKIKAWWADFVISRFKT